MGKKNKQSGLGRSIIKDRFGGKQPRSSDSFLHTSDLNDGYDWGRLNLQSITEQSHLDEFLATAELAGTEFTAEKLNVTFVSPEKGSEVLTADEHKTVLDVQEKHRKLLRIPRRPLWDVTTTAEELESKEREDFLLWRRELAELQEIKHLILTPFERNLDFWRQLWRVIERSDVVVQIVDARDPLLFRCVDLERYVKEVDERKINIILVNKADMLTECQREVWAKYFTEAKVTVAFWSATLEKDRQQVQNISEGSEDDPEDDSEWITDSEDDTESSEQQAGWDTEENTELSEQQRGGESSTHNLAASENLPDLSNNLETTHISAGTVASDAPDTRIQGVHNSSELLDGEGLVALLKTFYNGPTVMPGVTTVGLVGYPNVGKSSTINAILKTKKVPVSATPGRTKHFQTLFVDSELMLCDCPGLVMPTFVSTKADMIINGILPIDQMRDHVPPVARVCQLIPKGTLEAMYGVSLPKPNEGEDPNRPPTANELLIAYGYNRGYMTSHGIPDCPRTSRYILKDFVNGKLLYCHPPPGVSEDAFGSTPPTPETRAYLKMKEHVLTEAPKGPRPSSVDKEFFSSNQSRIGMKGTSALKDFKRRGCFSESELPPGNNTMNSLSGKPWKKHGNKGKKKKVPTATLR